MYIMISQTMSRKFYHFAYPVSALVIILVVSLSSPAFSGTLEDFEKDATEKRQHRYDKNEDEDEDEGFWVKFFGAIFGGLFGDDADDDDDYARSFSRNRRINSHSEVPSINLKKQVYNEILLPAFRLDSSYQNVKSDIDALDVRAEAGYGPFAMQGRITRYTEEEPSDELDLIQVHGLFRLPVSDQLQVGLGAGALILDGDNRNSGFSLTAPILVYPREFLGIEFRPAWSKIHENPLNDYDLGLVLSHSHVALRLGYRWVRSENESLDGPYLGFTFRF